MRSSLAKPFQILSTFSRFTSTRNSRQYIKHLTHWKGVPIWIPPKYSSSTPPWIRSVRLTAPLFLFKFPNFRAFLVGALRSWAAFLRRSSLCWLYFLLIASDSFLTNSGINFPSAAEKKRLIRVEIKKIRERVY